MGDPDAGVADAHDFCVRKERDICTREFAIGNLTAEEEIDCRMGVDAVCDGTMWPTGCEPTMEQVQACYDAIADPERLDEPSDALPECLNPALCGS